MSPPRVLGDVDWARWAPRDTATLLFVVRASSAQGAHGEREVLLIRKKRGLGAGKINGPGGRLEPDETSLLAQDALHDDDVACLVDILNSLVCQPSGKIDRYPCIRSG